jgi:hypothetical protein
VIVSIEPKPNEIVQRILSDLNINGAPKIAGHSRGEVARTRRVRCEKKCVLF